MDALTTPQIQPAPPAAPSVVPADAVEEFQVSNGILLSARQWIFLLVLSVLAFLFIPKLWERFEPLKLTTDYRIPYELGSDYWHYERVARAAVARHDVLLLGDSVVWGQYVTGAQTLSHYLNEQTRSARFANLGLDGSHPAALAGLIDYHAAAVANKKVILQCNPLWMSSPRHDLQERDEFRFNHPALVPQFFPRIPCYREEISRRLGYIIERNFPFFTFVSHIQIAYFNQTSIPEWTLEHPGENPLGPLRRKPEFEDRAHEQPQPWTERGITVQDLPWVPLETSFQWRSFRRAVEILQHRHNRLLVVLGPFNTHMLGASSRAEYDKRAQAIIKQLAAAGVTCVAPEALPSPLYADASHPLAEGYKLLAGRLLANPVFADFVK